MQGLAVHKLSGQLSTRQSCQEAVTAAATDATVQTAIFSINMQQTSQRQASMVRNMIDEAVKPAMSIAAPTSSADDMVYQASGAQGKVFILLLHFPPGDLVVNQYPALFMHGWDFWYLDSFAGGDAQNKQASMPEGLCLNKWLQAAVQWDTLPSTTIQDFIGVCCYLHACLCVKPCLSLCGHSLLQHQIADCVLYNSSASSGSLLMLHTVCQGLALGAELVDLIETPF